MLLHSLLLCGLLSFPLLAHAEAGPYNRVDFQVESAREVANDLLTATMRIQIQDRQPSRVAQQLNTALNDALKQAAAFEHVKASSGNQHTYPVYGKDNRVDGWRGHGEIRLESRDFKAAGDLIMRLQQTLQLGDIHFSVAPDTRAKIENELIAGAIKSFQERAEAIRAALGARAYRSVNLSINSGGRMPAPYPIAMARSAMTMEAAIPAPEFAAGDSRMAVQINGTIELQ
ncbi:MAG: SIMPL domain-containing protein [Nitrosomonadales bacterium]|nr:SIMPL domain-containing protein [Nitrosomonadales bacterium]